MYYLSAISGNDDEPIVKSPAKRGRSKGTSSPRQKGKTRKAAETNEENDNEEGIVDTPTKSRRTRSPRAKAQETPSPQRRSARGAAKAAAEAIESQASEDQEEEVGEEVEKSSPSKGIKRKAEEIEQEEEACSKENLQKVKIFTCIFFLLYIIFSP